MAHGEAQLSAAQFLLGKLIVACTIVAGGRGQARRQIRSFGTMSDDLAKLSDWLTEQGVTRCDGEHRRLLEANLQRVGRTVEPRNGASYSNCGTTSHLAVPLACVN
jgi:hypothetical protein